MKTYRLEILTPRGRFFEGDVVHTQVPAEDGFVGVLANHTSYVTSSPGGRFEIESSSGERKSFRIGPGFFQTAKNNACLLASFVEPAAAGQPTGEGTSPLH